MSETNLNEREELEEAALDGAKDKKYHAPILFKVKSVFRSKLIMSALVFLLSIATVLISLFAPLAKSVTSVKEVEIDIEYSGVDVYKIFYCSVLYMSDKKIAKTELYEKTVNDYTRYIEQSRPSSIKNTENHEKISSICKNMLLLTLAKKSVDIRFEVISASLMLSAVIITALLASLFSFSSLMGEIIGKIRHRKSKGGAFNREIRCLWLLAIILPTFAYSLSQMSFWGIGAELSAFSSNGYGICSSVVLLTALACIVAVYSVVRVLILNSERQSDGAAIQKKNILILFLVALMLLTLLLPVTKITFYKGLGTKQKTREVAITVEELSTLSEADIEYYKSIKKTQNQEKILGISKSIFLSSSDKDELCDNLINNLIIGVDRNDISIIYIFLQIATYLEIFVAAFLIIRLLRSLLYREKLLKSIKRLKLLLVLFAVTEAVLGGVVTVAAMLALSTELSAVMTVDFGIVPVLTVLLSVFLLVVRPDGNVRSKYADRSYDNADVTYAPYVIK